MTEPTTFAPADILAFWFSQDVKAKWFVRDDGFDAELRQRFGALLLKAKQGGLPVGGEPEGA